MNLELKSACRFKGERLESLKNVRKHLVQKYYTESLPSVASKRCNVASLELNSSSDPLTKNGNLFL